MKKINKQCKIDRQCPRCRTVLRPRQHILNKVSIYESLSSDSHVNRSIVVVKTQRKHMAMKALLHLAQIKALYKDMKTPTS